MQVRRPALRRPWPLRLRLTVAVAAVTAAVLAVTGVLVAVEFARGLDSRTDHELRERSASLAALARVTPRDELLGLSGEPLAQIFGPAGELRDSTRALGHHRLLTTAEVHTSKRVPQLLTHDVVAGTSDGARIRSFPVQDGMVMAIAEARNHREQELVRLGVLLTISLGAALLLAAVTGYQVAGAALRPVERIRSQAAAISGADLTQRLPQPGTGDELDRLTATLNDLLGRLAEALERERRIVSDASHELRTPISVLRTRLDVALRSGRRDDLHAVLRGAQGDAQRLARMADDLLVLARADQGGVPLRAELIDVQDLLEQVAMRHGMAAARTGRTIHVAVEVRGGAVVLADPDRLARALDNLVVNALEHGAGDVTLAARAPVPDRVELSVSDRGPGFADELLPRAFERFTQGSHGGRREDGGAGLGLAIVAALARTLGGDARATNRPDGGAEVTVTVPAA